MATSDNSETISRNSVSDKTEEEEPLIECAICLQTCIYPVQLPCKHIFCFLCVKGATTQSKRCAMCRAEIPPDYLDHPELISSLDLVQECTFEDGFQWFYEGRNGWWLYDERTGLEIEQFYKSGEKKCELLIAGFLYIIDFEHMMQFRRNDPNRRRQIKRDAATVPKKGIAGLRATTSDEGTNTQATTADDGDGGQTSNSNSQQQTVRSQHPTRAVPQLPPTRQVPQPPIRRPDRQPTVIQGPNQQSPSHTRANHQPPVIQGPNQQSSSHTRPDQQPSGSTQQPPNVRSQVAPALTARRLEQQPQPSNDVRQDYSSRNQRQQSPQGFSVAQDLPNVQGQDGQSHSIRSQGSRGSVGASRRSTNQPRPITTMTTNQPTQQDSTDEISQQFSNLSVRVSSSLPNSGFYWGGSSPSDDQSPSYQNIQNVEASPGNLASQPNQHQPPQDQPSLQQRSPPQRRSRQ